MRTRTCRNVPSRQVAFVDSLKVSVPFSETMEIPYRLMYLDSVRMHVEPDLVENGADNPAVARRSGVLAGVRGCILRTWLAGFLLI